VAIPRRLDDTVPSCRGPDRILEFEVPVRDNETQVVWLVADGGRPGGITRVVVFANQIWPVLVVVGGNPLRTTHCHSRRVRLEGTPVHRCQLFQWHFHNFFKCSKPLKFADRYERNASGLSLTSNLVAGMKLTICGRSLAAIVVQCQHFAWRWKYGASIVSENR